MKGQLYFPHKHNGRTEICGQVSGRSGAGGQARMDAVQAPPGLWCGGPPEPWCGGPGGGTRGPRSPGAYRAWVGGLVLGQLQVCTPGLAPGVRGGLKEATATPCPATKGAASLGPNFCPGGGLVAGQVSCPVPPGPRNQLRSAPRWGWSPSRTLFLSGGPSPGAPPPRRGGSAAV